VIITFTDNHGKQARPGRARQQLRAFAFELTRAEESERQAIARDLHDDLGQLLSVVKLKLSKHADRHYRGGCSANHDAIDELVGRAERSVRSLAVQLSPPVLYELGLVPRAGVAGRGDARNYDLSVELTDDGAVKPLEQPPAPSCSAPSANC